MCLLGLASLLSSCAITRPHYAMPKPPIEKPSCTDKIIPLQSASEECINLAAPALACMYEREAAADAYVDVLKNALQQVNK